MMGKTNGVCGAVTLSVTCVSAYIACYILRNILSVVSPEMIASGYTTEYIGIISSVYYVIYACGQLINGYVGERIRAKYMVSVGLMVASVCSVLFAFCKAGVIGVLLFGVIGFSLSMLRGPIVKTICENTDSKIAHLACVFLSFSGFVGPLAASLLSLVMGWQAAFVVSGVIGMAFALLVYLLLTVFEARGIIGYGEKKKGKKLDVFGIFKLEGFLFYLAVSMLCDVAYIAISFWLPTYLTEKLDFSAGTAGILYSVISFARALTPFAALFILKLLKNKDRLLIRIIYIIASFALAAALFVDLNYVNVALMLIALVAIGMASSMVWSNYIPNQAESGLTSSLNGFLDFTGYAVASVCNLFVSYAVGWFGWDGVVIMWSSIAVIGVLATFVLNNKKTVKNKEH